MADLFAVIGILFLSALGAQVLIWMYDRYRSVIRVWFGVDKGSKK